jgi:hypothetical protein
LLNKVKYSEIGILPFVFIISVVFYIAASVLFFSAHVLIRLFIPLIPLVFLFIYSSLFISSNAIFPQKYGTYITAVASIALVSICFLSFPMKNFIQRPRPSMYRWVFNLLKDKVDLENKLLVTPHSIVPTEGFSSACYFRGNSIYIYKCDKPFEDFANENNIRYIYFSKRKTYPSVTEDLACYSVGKDKYTKDWEYSYITNKLAKNNSRGLISESVHGYIFDISSETY